MLYRMLKKTKPAEIIYNRFNALEQNRDELYSRISSLEQNRDELYSRISSLEQNRDELYSRISSLEQNRDELYSRINTLEKQDAKDKIIHKYMNERMNVLENERRDKWEKK